MFEVIWNGSAQIRTRLWIPTSDVARNRPCHRAAIAGWAANVRIVTPIARANRLVRNLRAAYQASRESHDRDITILDKKVPETVDNFPFLHIKRVGDRCDSTLGGLRKSIRLCKNVKADAATEGTDIFLPSFDIASAMYHADLGALRLGSIYEISILAETQRFLDYLACNHEYVKTLLVPDGSRAIFNTNAKLAGLNRLSIEMDELAKEVAKEQKPVLAIGALSLSESRAAIESLLIR
jgi:hypothetical protein